jgi:hypothetical protein
MKKKKLSKLSSFGRIIVINGHSSAQLSTRWPFVIVMVNNHDVIVLVTKKTLYLVYINQFRLWSSLEWNLHLFQYQSDNEPIFPLTHSTILLKLKIWPTNLNLGESGHNILKCIASIGNALNCTQGYTRASLEP